MWWWKRRPEPEPQRPEGAAGRVPDGDTVPFPGYERWADLIGRDAAARALDGPTMLIRGPLTPAQEWRAAGGRGPIVPTPRRAEP